MRGPESIEGLVQNGASALGVDGGVGVVGLAVGGLGLLVGLWLVRRGQTRRNLPLFR